MPSMGSSYLAPSGGDVAYAKARARLAYACARDAGGALSAIVIDCLWAGTLLTIAGQPEATANQVLRRSEHFWSICMY